MKNVGRCLPEELKEGILTNWIMTGKHYTLVVLVIC